MIQVSKRWAFKDKCHFISYSTYYCQELIESFDDCEYADNTCQEKEIVYMPMSNIVRSLNASHLFVFSKSNFIIKNDLYLKMTNYIISFKEPTNVTIFNKSYCLIKFVQQEKVRILSFNLKNETVLSSWMECNGLNNTFFIFFVD